MGGSVPPIQPRQRLPKPGGLPLRDGPRTRSRSPFIKSPTRSVAERRTPCTIRTVELLSGCSRAPAFRALVELTVFGLIERVGYGYTFVPDVVQRLRLHMPRLRCSPVRDALVKAILC